MSAWLKCVHIDHKNGTALVRSRRTGRSFPVTVKKNINNYVSHGDLLHVIRSSVSKEWMAIDYMAMTALTTGDDE